MPVIESLLRVTEASKLTGVSTRTFWKLIASGRAPEVVRIGRAVRIRASDLDQWIKLGCPSRDVLEAAKGGAAR
jgi:excisionase family DNA binding protein